MQSIPVWHHENGVDVFSSVFEAFHLKGANILNGRNLPIRSGAVVNFSVTFRNRQSNIHTVIGRLRPDDIRHRFDWLHLISNLVGQHVVIVPQCNGLWHQQVGFMDFEFVLLSILLQMGP